MTGERVSAPSAKWSSLRNPGVLWRRLKSASAKARSPNPIKIPQLLGKSTHLPTAFPAPAVVSRDGGDAVSWQRAVPPVLRLFPQLGLCGMFPVQPVPSPSCIFWGKYLLLGKVVVVFRCEPGLASKAICKRVIAILRCQNWQEEEG